MPSSGLIAFQLAWAFHPLQTRITPWPPYLATKEQDDDPGG
jgi:hypothetical protein